MKITNHLPKGGRRLFLYVGMALAALFLGIGAWVAARSQPPVADRPARAARSPQTSKHFTGKVHFDILAKLLADDRRGVPTDEWMRELADPKAKFRVEAQHHPLLHQAAPEFTLEDQRGQSWSLRGHIARGPVVLVFYLGYSCSACVHDLFELNADIDRFHGLGAEVIGVSGDTPSLTRQQFEQYGAFAFPVLFDPGHLVAQSYGAFRAAKGSKPEELLHGTFLIGRDGQVHWVSYGDTPFRNNKALLYELAHLENKLPRPKPAAGIQGKESETP